MDAELIELIESALRTGNQLVIGVLAVILILVNIVGYFLFRAQVNYKIKKVNRNFQTVLSQQSALSETTGRIEEALKQESILLQLRADQYFQKSTNAIESVYLALIKLRDTAMRVAHNDPSEFQDELVECVTQFRSEHDANRIWLPESIARTFEETAIKIDSKALAFIRAEPLISNPGTVPTERLERAIRCQEDFYDFITQELPDIFSAVVNDIEKHVSPLSHTTNESPTSNNSGAR